MLLYHSMNAVSVVGTLQPYLIMQKNLFEVFALIGGGTETTLGASAYAGATW